ncbi:VanZ family protein [Atopobiaceae bacterium 24-176]
MLRAYSGPFKLAMALWPLASFVLTLPVLAMVYHRRGRITLASLAWSYLAVLYLVGLACFTCYPLPTGTSGPGITYGVAPQLDPLAFVGDIRRDGIRAVFQVAANVVLFVPLGYMLAYGLRWRLGAVALSGFAVSLLIECSQLTGLFGLYRYAYRTFDVDDLFANTLGAVCGLVCAWIVSRVVGRGDYVEPAVTHSPGFVRRCVAAIIDLGLVWVGTMVAGTSVSVALWVVGRALGPDATVALYTVLSFCLVVALELLVPVARQGSTLGGGFVRMSCETRARSGWRRALFYAVRLFCVSVRRGHCHRALGALGLGIRCLRRVLSLPARHALRPAARQHTAPPHCA